MTQSSEERVSADGAPQSARIIPFERPQNELQRAVQQRAQERIESEGHQPKVSVTRRVITFVIALIPVSIIVMGFALAVHAIHVITSLYAQPEQNTQVQPPPAPEPAEPGVVILVPDKNIQPVPATTPAQAAPAQQDK